MFVRVEQAARYKQQVEDLAVWADGVTPGASLAIFQV